MTTRTLAAHIASTLLARHNCMLNGNTDWQEKHEDRLKEMENLLPSGSGFDMGTKIPRDLSDDPETFLEFVVDYHLMNGNGCYCGWVQFKVSVNATFDGIHVSATMTGHEDLPRDEFEDLGGEGFVDHTEEYVAETFHQFLTTQYTLKVTGLKKTAA
tara:strand:+ start:9310 stop:9780 length:471 start_codon:yes stop_codon:yes gene_type:complete